MGAHEAVGGAFEDLGGLLRPGVRLGPDALLLWPELDAGLRSLGYTEAALSTSKALQTFDESKSGTLELNEFASLVLAVHEEMVQFGHTEGKQDQMRLQFQIP